MSKHLVIAGGGVGALEALLALQSLTPDTHRISVLTAGRYVTYRALSVAEPFGADPAPRYEWIDTRDGPPIRYDALLLALGAHPKPAQQADVAAADIAARFGASIDVEPYRPVLEGLLLTGAEPEHLQRSPRPESRSASQPLLSPAQKIGGRHLAPYLAKLGNSPSGQAASRTAAAKARSLTSMAPRSRRQSR